MKEKRVCCIDENLSHINLLFMFGYDIIKGDKEKANIGHYSAINLKGNFRGAYL